MVARADIDALQAEEQARVFEAKAEGKSNRQAAKAAGVHHDTVAEWTGGGKFQGGKIRHPAEPARTPDDIPAESTPWASRPSGVQILVLPHFAGCG